MVGEIRDKETAEIAIQASLTGHLVLSTVHTNDAAGATTRLADMGIEPFLVASSLCGILAQRLIRTLCKHCKKPYHPTAEQAAKINLEVTPDMVFYQEVGCDKCLNTGYSGRRGIYELLGFRTTCEDSFFKVQMPARSNALQWKKARLFSTTARKVLEGITSPEEALCCSGKTKSLRFKHASIRVPGLDSKGKELRWILLKSQSSTQTRGDSHY